MYATPWLMSATPPELVRPTPALGEHNDSIFRELMGLSDEEIESLVGKGILV